MPENLEVRTASVNGIEMSYAVFGNGKKPFVMIPGLSIRSVLRVAAVIAAQYQMFAGEHTIYLFDVRKNLPDVYSLDDFAEDMSAVMKSLGLSDVYLYGTSMGGMISLLLAARHPELVKKLAVCSTMCRQTSFSGPVLGGWRDMCLAGRDQDLVVDMIDTVYSKATLDKFRDQYIGLFPDVSDEELRRIAILCDAMVRLDAFEDIKKISCPVLAIGSEGDRVLGPEGTRDVAEALGCGCTMFGPDTAHAIYDEQPDVLPMVKEFFGKD